MVSGYNCKEKYRPVTTSWVSVSGELLSSMKPQKETSLCLCLILKVKNFRETWHNPSVKDQVVCSYSSRSNRSEVRIDWGCRQGGGGRTVRKHRRVEVMDKSILSSERLTKWFVVPVYSRGLYLLLFLFWFVELCVIPVEI